jgi:hypothetical protein
MDFFDRKKEKGGSHLNNINLYHYKMTFLSSTKSHNIFKIRSLCIFKHSKHQNLNKFIIKWKMGMNMINDPPI